jgi:hypothetical protein
LGQNISGERSPAGEKIMDLYDKDFIMDVKQPIDEAFTRQHYKKIADIVRDVKDIKDKGMLIDRLCAMFKSDNSLFDEKKFRAFIGD